MKRIIWFCLLLALLCVLAGCSQQPSDDPTAAVTVTVTQAPMIQPEPTDTLPSRVFTEEQPALPYLRISHYVNGEYVSGFLALTDEEVAQAARETANVDVADVIEVCTMDNPKGNYGLMPPLYVALAAAYAGFQSQSPADIGEIVSATMSVTQSDEPRTQTITTRQTYPGLEPFFAVRSESRYQLPLDWRVGADHGRRLLHNHTESH